ncbi:hypothetical protein [Patulibacter minatonensis]|uniref:hypothetical protein n=1 Tax=Patulibacter minatonensis TaxID=298163 RepID=UPI0004789A03|nr:hypothetical protein [Patulibacter minatonensis]
MTAVRDLVLPQVVQTGEDVQDLHRLLMESATPLSRDAAQRKAAKLAEAAAALASALSDAEVFR